jgi:CheY-like chemotaxis protein
VLDLNLPRANGWEVLRNLAADPPLKMPRMLLYTGQELTPEEHREAARLSATVAVKDGSLDVIRRMIRASLSDPGPDVLSGCRLLLVEDDTASLFALGRELRRRGAEVEEAKNGREAIETLGDRRDVDAVLMDIRMPVMDGYEAMRGIRRNAVHRDLPVLALTADATADDRDRCLAAGATEFVVKPVDPDDLVRTLTGYLGQAN